MKSARGKSSFDLQPSFSLTKLLIDIGFLRILLVVFAPFRSIIAWNILCGRSIFTCAKLLENSVLRSVGWLSGPPKSRTLRRVFELVDVRRWHLVAAALVLYSTISTALKAWRDSKDEQIQQRRALQRNMDSSKSYFEWSIYATKLDRLDGTDEAARWRSETKHYDRALLEEKTSHLRSVSAVKASVRERMFAVRTDLLRNLGNMASASLHEHFPLIPTPIREYIDEVRTQLEDITQSTEIPLLEKSAFLKETRHAFGRTALVLSGGGPLGAFHLGVVKALLEHKLLPRVLAGSSVGALVCGLVATRTENELISLLEDVSLLDLSFFSDATTGSSLGPSNLFSSAAGKTDEGALSRRLRHMLGDLTFLEAYTLTGRVLNLSVAACGCSEPPRLLNYLTAPHVIVWSAVSCSFASAGSGGPRELLARSATGDLVKFCASETPGAGAAPSSGSNGWHDGSLEHDLPMKGMSEMFSVNHFIVSQTTPHIIPFLNLKRSLGVAGQLAEAEIKHRCRQALEILPRWNWPARYLRAFSQPWEGDITIVLPDVLAQLAKSVTGPSKRDLLQAVRQGELCTWAKLSAIQCNCGIEATLDACIQQVVAEERAEHKQRKAAAMPFKSRASGKLPGRLPSWADLESLQYHYKMGNSSSNESLFSLSLSHAATTSAATGAVGSQFKRPSSATAVVGIPSISPFADSIPFPAQISRQQWGQHNRPPLSPIPSTVSSFVPEAAYECTDESANAFRECSPAMRRSPTPTSLATEKGLDYVAP